MCLDFGHFSDFIRLYRHVGYDFMFLALDKNAVTTDEQGVYELDKNWTKWTNGQKPLKHSMNASFRPLNFNNSEFRLDRIAVNTDELDVQDWAKNWTKIGQAQYTYRWSLRHVV